LHVNPHRPHDGPLQLALITRRPPQILQLGKYFEHRRHPNRRHFRADTSMDPPAKVNVLVERAIKLDFERVGKHIGLFIRVVLQLGGWTEIRGIFFGGVLGVRDR
jgi:hypothetical protein